MLLVILMLSLMVSVWFLGFTCRPYALVFDHSHFVCRPLLFVSFAASK
jgi:hypothetical protein